MVSFNVAFLLRIGKATSERQELSQTEQPVPPADILSQQSNRTYG